MIDLSDVEIKWIMTVVGVLYVLVLIAFYALRDNPDRGEKR
jgi:hypothetical protein